MQKLILYLSVLFAANSIQMITGFAGNLLAMPFAIAIIGYDSARVSINLFTLLGCSILSYQNHAYIRFRILLQLLAYMLAGVVLALCVQQYLPQQILRYSYGGFLLLVAIYQLLHRENTHLGKKASVIMAVAAGIIHTLFLSGGALLALLLSQKLKGREEFRATISTSWIILDSLLIIQHTIEGLYTARNIAYILWSIPVCLCSVSAGQLLYKRINSNSFQALIHVLLLISGFSMFLS